MQVVVDNQDTAHHGQPSNPPHATRPLSPWLLRARICATAKDCRGIQGFLAQLIGLRRYLREAGIIRYRRIEITDLEGGCEKRREGAVKTDRLLNAAD